MAAARNATLDFRTGDFLRASFKAVIIVAIMRWCLDRSLESNSYRFKMVCSPGISVLEMRRLGSLSLSERMCKMIRKREQVE